MDRYILRFIALGGACACIYLSTFSSLIQTMTGTFFGAQMQQRLPEPQTWMLCQIEQEFASFQRQKKISKKQMNLLIDSKEFAHLQLLKVTIQDNKVRVRKNFSAYSRRVGLMKRAIERICRKFSLPDMELILSVHDEIDAQFDVPLFVMAKNRYNNRQILIPDFEALHGKYQVLKRGDITREVISWEKKKDQLIWRGSTAQKPIKGFHPLQEGNTNSFSRVRLCELTQKYPQKIDAKFTLYVGEAKKIRSLMKLSGKFMPFEEQLNYKYHLLIDGNSCAYSASGWKLFTNSLLFKADSDSIQWYYNALKPYVHYIPISAGLEDLLEKLLWAETHVEEAQAIAKQAREFALTHIIKEQNELYLYQTLLEYSKLLFVD
jgi:hypothetical protein